MRELHFSSDLLTCIGYMTELFIDTTVNKKSIVSSFCLYCFILYIDESTVYWIRIKLGRSVVFLVRVVPPA